MKRRLIPLTVMLLVMLLLGVVAARATNGFYLGWWTVDGGGSTSTSGDGRFSLSGTIGQPDASLQLQEAPFSLGGGYWYGAGVAGFPYEVHLPVVTRQ